MIMGCFWSIFVGFIDLTRSIADFGNHTGNFCNFRVFLPRFLTCVEYPSFEWQKEIHAVFILWHAA